MGCKTELRGWGQKGDPQRYCLTHSMYTDLAEHGRIRDAEAAAAVLVPDEPKDTRERPPVPESAKHPCGDTAVHDAHHWIELVGPHEKEDYWCIGVPYMPTEPGDIVLDADKVAWVRLTDPDGPKFRCVYFYAHTPSHLAVTDANLANVGPSMLRKPWTVLVAKQVMDELDWTLPVDPPPPVKNKCPQCDHSLNVHGFSGCVARSNADGMCICKYIPPF